MSNENEKIKSLIKIREENEALRNRIQFLQMENFEYNLQCNRMKNKLEIVKKVTQEIPQKLNEVVKNISSILADDYDSTVINDGLTNQESNEPATESLTPPEPGPSQVNLRRKKLPNAKEQCSKTQLVSPHRVNGHVLSHHFNPTVNLPRMSQNVEESDRDTE